MRNQRSGNIVNISSLAGYIGFPASSVYASTKFALEGLSESLAYEIEPYRINVILIELGVINTNFVENIIMPANTQSISSSLLSSSLSHSTSMAATSSSTNNSAINAPSKDPE